MVASRTTRRRFVAGSVAASAFVAAPFVRGAHAAGKLTLALWDHWVPNANNATKTAIDEWAAKEKVEVQVDFITSQGNKLLLTGAAEAQAKSGHDIFAFSTWLPSRYGDQLVAMNDVMETLIKQNGAVNATNVVYLAFNSAGFHATFSSSLPQGATFPGKFKLCATNPSTTNNTRISMSLTTS